MNYSLVGAFVLLLGAMIIGIAVWLASAGSFHKQYDRYRAIENESVAGLNVNAPVRYNGVEVGRVQAIRLDPVDPGLVNLVLDIEQGTPIKVDTVAILKAQALTGIAYIELSGGAPDAAALRPTPGDPNPLIRTKPSLSARLEDVLTNVLAKLDRTTENLNALLSEENRAALTTALVDIAAVTRTLAARRIDIDRGIVSAARTFENSVQGSAQLGPAIDRIGRAANALESMGQAVTRASTGAGVTVETIGAEVKRITTGTLPALEHLMGELGALATALRRFSDQTERNPNGLIFGRHPVPEGPGESPPSGMPQ